MERISVTSRIIVAMNYDEQQRLLQIFFRNGQARLFAGVPRDLVREFAQSPSPGNFYLERVREQYQRLAA